MAVEEGQVQEQEQVQEGAEAEVKTQSEDDIIRAAIEAAGDIEEPGESTEEAAEEAGEESTEEAEVESSAGDTEDQSPEEVRYAQRLAELARRDRLVRREKQQLAQSRSELKELHDRAQGIIESHGKLKESLRADPLGSLKQHFDLDIMDLLAASSANDDSDQAPSRAEKELAKLQARLDEMEQRGAERERQLEEQNRSAHLESVYSRELSRIEGVVGGNPEGYEAIIDRGQTGLADVFTALDAMYRQLVEDGHQPGPPDDGDIAAAAKIVENVYRERELEDLRSKAERKRFAGRLTLKGPDIEDAAPSQRPNAASRATPTLTNSLQGEAPQKKRYLTDEERLAAALAIPLPSETENS